MSDEFTPSDEDSALRRRAKPRLSRRSWKKSSGDELSQAAARWAANEDTDRKAEEEQEEAEEEQAEQHKAALNAMLSKPQEDVAQAGATKETPPRGNKLYKGKRRGSSSDDEVARAVARWAENEVADRQAAKEAEAAAKREALAHKAALNEAMSRMVRPTEVDEERLLQAGVPENKIQEAVELTSAAAKAEEAAAEAVARAKQMLAEAAEAKAAAAELLSNVHGVQMRQEFKELMEERAEEERMLDEYRAKLIFKDKELPQSQVDDE